MSKIIIISRLNKDLETQVLESQYKLKDAFKIVSQELTKHVKEKGQLASLTLFNHFVAKSYGIIGFPKFIDGHYIHFITKRKKVCSFLGADVYTIEEAKLEMLLNKDLSCLYKISSDKTSEIKYLEYFNDMDLKNFYYSYELDLTTTIQQKYQHQFSKHDQPLRQRSKFIWNSAGLGEFSKQMQFDEFILPIVYGYIESNKIKISNSYLDIVLISRRSRFNFGVRFLSRGINEEGEVANEIETEIIIIEQFPFGQAIKNIYSFVMIRGSIPLFWGHEKFTISYKPRILIYQEKNKDYKSSEKHFSNLFQVYGKELFVLNLIKKNDKSQETELGIEYKNLVTFLQNYERSKHTGNKIHFKWFDFLGVYQSDESQLIQTIQQYAIHPLEQILYFHYNQYSNINKIQGGIFRVNCIDCLDRTNNAMACIASVFIGRVISNMNLQGTGYVDTQTLICKDELLSKVFEIFGRMGDVLAEQYAGSAAFHKAQLNKIDGDWKPIRQNIALIAVKRYISNVITDYEKQKTLKLFLGEFVPDIRDPLRNLWEYSEVKYIYNVTDITESKKFLRQRITFTEKILQQSQKLFNENNCFSEEKIIVLDESENRSREQKDLDNQNENKQKEQGKMRSEEQNQQSYLGFMNYLDQFKNTEKNSKDVLLKSMVNFSK